ncbi:MAG TPA: 4-hydroxyphenylacetate 3-hydroxylase N-terminal domain-containing protein [Stellaceae bacterium]|jgi:4-hydroxyphenylacetate 3-monooxygenase|nr:4-hydroxyphenylacetate 3-hydroxylase N-terminal domain-containing protein [Stellaceae bacterium]
MRTGAEYREALRDGRRVFVMGEGRVQDVTTHPATAAMVEEYVAWYDRHLDPDWQDILFAPATSEREKTAWAYVLPKNSADLVGIARSFAKTLFHSAGNMTHDPAYGHLIAMGVLTATQEHKHSAKNIADAETYRASIAKTGRFLTFCGGAAPIGHRLRPDPAERAALKLVKETDAGVVISGRIGMHTSPAYAEDVYVGALNGVKIGDHCASFIVPVADPGVTTVCRKLAPSHKSRFLSPLSGRFDELDGQMWLDNVAIPWERVFFVEPSPEPIATYLLWHHLYGWLARAEFTLGLALALADSLGLKEAEPTVELLLDLVVEVQTVRACLTAAERDPSFTVGGNCYANYTHLMVGGIALQKARQRISEILRQVPGSSLVVAPADTDLDDPEISAELEACFAGGGWTARQRAALLQLAADHVSSALEGRESSFELHASGGIPVWRGRLRQRFPSYNDLANAVLKLIDIPMPEIDVGNIPAIPLAPRRVNTVTPPPSPEKRT